MPTTCFFASGYVWIGLSDLDTEGVFKWPNGAQLSYDFWASGEPNSMPVSGYYGEQDCVVLNSNGLVADKACSHPWQSLCSTLGMPQSSLHFLLSEKVDF